MYVFLYSFYFTNFLDEEDYKKFILRFVIVQGNFFSLFFRFKIR